jgi:hypothetical protein
MCKKRDSVENNLSFRHTINAVIKFTVNLRYKTRWWLELLLPEAGLEEITEIVVRF